MEAAAAAEPEEEEDNDEVQDNSYLKDDLPTQRPKILSRISSDIHIDRRNSKITLNDDNALGGTGDDDHVPAKKKIEISVALDRTLSLNKTLTGDGGTNKKPVLINRQESLKRENLGGNAAWEALRATNDPKAYKAATVVARGRYSIRRNTTTGPQA